MDLQEYWAENKKAQEKIEKELRMELPRMVGPHILVKVYIEGAQGKELGIIMPDSVKETNVYDSYSGTVVALGNECFKNEKLFPEGPRYKIGDHVMILAGMGARFKYQGVAMQICYDDKIMCVVSDPSFIRRC